MDAVNFQSLNLVRDELVAAIQKGADHLENFADDENIFAKLGPCVESINQIIGTLSLIEFRGAELLARELLATVEKVSPDFKKARYQRWLEVTSTAFVVLTRYIEYVQQTEKRLPMLLIPQINELRKFRGDPSLPEGYFFQVDLEKSPAVPSVDVLKLGDGTQKAGIRRIRYMYQIGLIGLIRERQLDSSIALMRRGITRLHRMGGSDQPIALLWWLTDVAICVFSEEGMQPLETRKLLFARVERIIRHIEKNGSAALNEHLPKEIIKELVYLIALSASKRSDVKAILEAYGLGGFTFTDCELEKQRRQLNGPSLETVKTLVDILKAELSTAKDILETASQSAPHEIDEFEGFMGTLKRVSETLLVVGQNSASYALKDLIEKATDWQGKQNIEAEELEEAANTLLYLDAVVGFIASAKLNDEKLEKANKIAQSDVIASGLLADAKGIAISEMKSSLLVVKTALSDLSKSGFGQSDISDILGTLVKVRGAFCMMNCNQAANILLRSARFAEEMLLDQKEPLPDMEENLEAFADAIISVEYYLNSASGSFRMDKSTLALAEESLSALGYSDKAEVQALAG